MTGQGEEALDWKRVDLDQMLEGILHREGGETLEQVAHEAADASSLEALQARLDGAGSNLGCGRCPCLQQGVGTT